VGTGGPLPGGGKARPGLDADHLRPHLVPKSRMSREIYSGTALLYFLWNPEADYSVNNCLPFVTYFYHVRFQVLTTDMKMSDLGC
jgi:hypothetical protein